MSFRNIFTKLFVLYSSMVFYSFAYYSKKDAFCTGKQLTLLPQKIYSICGTYVSKKDALTPPIVKVERVPKHEAKKYILIMIDPDRFPDSKWVWLHWMKTNIPSKKFQGITTEKSDVVDYEAPKQTSGVYRIQFLLYQQMYYPAIIELQDRADEARAFKMVQFENENHLKPLMNYQYLLFANDTAPTSLKNWGKDCLINMVVMYLGMLFP